MKNPVLVLDGKEYIAKAPKAKIWREILAFDKNKKDLDIEDFILAHCKILASIFDVDAEEIEDKAALEDIVSLYQQCFVWITGLITRKMNELPDENPKNE